jgi:hypothetical protein
MTIWDILLSFDIFFPYWYIASSKIWQPCRTLFFLKDQIGRILAILTIFYLGQWFLPIWTTFSRDGPFTTKFVESWVGLHFGRFFGPWVTFSQ